MVTHSLSAPSASELHDLLSSAAAHVNRDECEAAETLSLQALEAVEAEAGPDSIQLVPILEALAGLLWYVGRHDDAREYANRAIELKLPRQPGSGLRH